MLFEELGLNRNLSKTDSTPGITNANPTLPSNPNSTKDYMGDLSNNASNIHTGTVITSCFIQTSALPSRIEIAGNDVKFFDDTYTENGIVKGDASRLVFTHDLNKEQGFIMEKRASIYDTYDNVLSWYATPAREGRHNYMFIGRNAYIGDPQFNTNFFGFHVNQDTSIPAPTSGDPTAEAYINGKFQIEVSQDGVLAEGYTPFVVGASKGMFGAPYGTGFSSYISSGDGGIAGLGYRVLNAGHYVQNVVFYIRSVDGKIVTETDILPLTNNTYNLGSPSLKFNTIYGSVVACPLPTVEDPLKTLEKIPPPVFVGDRGHYGFDKKYYDDLTFPEEILHTTIKGEKEIEHNTMIGFLLQTVIELNRKIKIIEENLP